MAPRRPVDPELLARLEAKRATARREWLAAIQTRDRARSKAGAVRVTLAVIWITVQAIALWLFVLEVVRAFEIEISPAAGTFLLTGVILTGIWTAQLLGRSPGVEGFVSTVAGGLDHAEEEALRLADLRDQVEEEYFDTKYQPTPIER